MKKYIIHGLCCLISIICFSTCNNDFLDDRIDPTSADAIFPETLYLTGNEQGTQQFELSVLNAKNAHYKIMVYPQWMLFTAMEGNFNNDKAIFNFEFNKSYQNYPEPGHEIPGHMTLDIDGLGVIQLNISYVNPGEPRLGLSPTTFDFGTKINKFEETIRNEGNGPLNWKITEKPDWIVVEGDAEGVLPQGNSVNISFICNRNSKEPGKYTGNIVFESNAIENPRQTIVVNMEVLNYVNPESTTPIEGTVTDSWYNKSKDLLYIATKTPNFLLVYDTKQNIVQKVALNKAPNCIEVSNDGNLILVGQSGQLTCINGQSLTVTKQIELDFNVFDVAYGENNWCYLTARSNNSTFAPWYYVDLNANKVYEKNIHGDNIYANTYLRKIPGSPLLLASRKDISPNGVILIDISQNVPGEQRYWHESFGVQFWFSDDGKYTYGSGSTVFKTPNFTTGDVILPLGQLGQNNLNWADYSSSTNSIWISPLSGWWISDREVKRFSANDYTLIQSFLPSDYVTTIGGVKDYYPTIAHYIFTNQSGNHLFLVKNVTNESSSADYNFWSIEKFKIQ